MGWGEGALGVLSLTLLCTKAPLASSWDASWGSGAAQNVGWTGWARVQQARFMGLAQLGCSVFFPHTQQVEQAEESPAGLPPLCMRAYLQTDLS